MIQTISYNHNNFPIPSNQIFEKVLNLTESLTGQSVKIKSIFNSADKDPSMVIFYAESDGMYRFKDFSSGQYGDAIDIVQYMYQLKTRQEAFRKALEMFKNNVDIKSTTVFAKETKEVTDYTIRKWLNSDADYWKQFGIKGSFLKKYNIKPLSKYTIEMERNGVKSQMVFDSGKMMYGFFSKDNSLYKIYQPNRKIAKFLKIKDHLQGEEQLTMNAKCLIIASSLKDIGAFQSMRLPDIELVAPDSENVTITASILDKYKSNYQYVFTMFDNDTAGIKAMNMYWTEHAIPYIHFDYEKDLAESVKQHGVDNTKIFFKLKFKDAIRKNNKTSRK